MEINEIQDAASKLVIEYKCMGMSQREIIGVLMRSIANVMDDMDAATRRRTVQLIIDIGRAYI